MLQGHIFFIILRRFKDVSNADNFSEYGMHLWRAADVKGQDR
jgi:hypothetical protein